MEEKMYTLEEVKQTVRYFAQCDYVANFFIANKHPTAKQIQDMVKSWWDAIDKLP